MRRRAGNKLFSLARTLRSMIAGPAVHEREYNTLQPHKDVIPVLDVVESLGIVADVGARERRFELRLQPTLQKIRGIRIQ